MDVFCIGPAPGPGAPHLRHHARGDRGGPGCRDSAGAGRGGDARADAAVRVSDGRDFGVRVPPRDARGDGDRRRHHVGAVRHPGRSDVGGHGARRLPDDAARGSRARARGRALQLPDRRARWRRRARGVGAGDPSGGARVRSARVPDAHRARPDLHRLALRAEPDQGLHHGGARVPARDGRTGSAEQHPALHVRPAVPVGRPQRRSGRRRPLRRRRGAAADDDAGQHRQAPDGSADCGRDAGRSRHARSQVADASRQPHRRRRRHHPRPGRRRVAVHRLRACAADVEAPGDIRQGQRGRACWRRAR